MDRHLTRPMSDKYNYDRLYESQETEVEAAMETELETAMETEMETAMKTEMETAMETDTEHAEQPMEGDGAPKGNTERRTVEKETKAHDLTMDTITKRATDRQQWRSLVVALCRHLGHGWVTE